MAARLFHVSDLHFGRADQEALDWFAGRVAAERPDAVICTGDLTMRARSAEYAAAAKWLARLDVPLMVQPGNHDLPYFNPAARFLAPYGRYRRMARAIERPLDVHGVWLVPLKTTARFQWRWNWSWGVVSRSGLVAAIDLLRARPPDHVAIVACHHPLVDTDGHSRHGETLRGKDALAALAAAGADAVLSGHVHDPFDRRWPLADGGAIRLIGAGTLSERVRSTRPSFNELIVEDGALDVRLRILGEVARA
ncbi:metallophosphoesterase [Sphingomonas oleivorans]|uniref:Metallophosphoesterase n=1 Tax=Sphingomonas oleivorans TaxID=1735121 RepID=A0A2T5FYT5_9SPHN|nr:metallophosphoesterase [Sphingomonas oleivorans]PTQ11681.1 metallophosphoesterase [Sphingomonas oleivorans]